MKSHAKRVLRGKTDSVLAQVIRYAAGGAVAFAVDIVVLVGLTELAGWHYLVSATVGFACGVATHYAVSVVWVFHLRSLTNRPAEFAAFVLLGTIGMGINVLSLYLFTEFGGVYYALSKVLASVPSFTWNFTSRKLLLFSACSVGGGEPKAATDATT